VITLLGTELIFASEGGGLGFLDIQKKTNHIELSENLEEFYFSNCNV
jgi:hypothetical protein